MILSNTTDQFNVSKQLFKEQFKELLKTMPFKTKTQEIVKSGDNILSHQQSPLHQEGLNSSNLGGFELEPISKKEMTKRQNDLVNSNKQINANTENILKTAKMNNKKGPSYYGLTKPILADIPKPFEEMTEIDIKIANLVIDKIWNCIWYLEIAEFFMQPTRDEILRKTHALTPQERLNLIVNKATRHDYQICMELYRIPDIDTATDLAVLCLFNIIMLIDDSGSMKTTGMHDMTGKLVQGGTEDYDPTEGPNNNLSRWELSKLLVKVGAQVMTMFDDDGISVRFLNSYEKGDNILCSSDVDNLFKRKIVPAGGTMIGMSLRKIYEEFIEGQLQSNTLEKPILILTYTDGASSDNIKDVVRFVRSNTKNSKYGSKCVLFSFAQVGNDRSATDMLEDLDSDPDSVLNGCDGAGDITDCTSSFKIEKEQFDKSQKMRFGQEAPEYTEIFHQMKGWIGAIMEKYDKSDETPIQKSFGIFKSFL